MQGLARRVTSISAGFLVLSAAAVPAVFATLSTTATRAAIGVAVVDTSGHPVAGATVLLEEYDAPGVLLKTLTTNHQGVATGFASAEDDRLAVSVEAAGYLAVHGTVVPRRQDATSGAFSFTTEVKIAAVVQPAQAGTCADAPDDTIRCTFHAKNISADARAVTELRLVIERIEESCSSPGMFVRLVGDASGVTFFAVDAEAFAPAVQGSISGNADIDCSTGLLTLTMSHAFPAIAPSSVARIGISLPRELALKDGEGKMRALTLLTADRKATASVAVDGGWLFGGQAPLAFKVN